MQISPDVIGFTKSLSQEFLILKRTEPAFLKPCLKVTTVSSIAIEINSSRGTFSAIAIGLKIDGQRALTFASPQINNTAIPDMQISTDVKGFKKAFRYQRELNRLF